jgi:NTE family protein
VPIVASPKTINLALQGGGSHGAFTWGVLDRLLEEDNLTIEGISGTSAGAMNAVALLQGHCKGGSKGAKESLENFWRGVGELSLGDLDIDFSPLTTAADAWQRMFSPYQTNPFNINPLRDLLTKILDIEAIRAWDAIKLFICATNVENGRAHIFERKDLTIDALMASACLPFIFQTVNIGGTPYWDGGYTGNPAIFPLIYNCESPDVVLVQITPLTRRGTPETPIEIINRLNEISFNAAIIGEMHAIALVQRVIEEDYLKKRWLKEVFRIFRSILRPIFRVKAWNRSKGFVIGYRYVSEAKGMRNSEAARLKNMNMHVISAERSDARADAFSKLNASMDFLLHLKEIGRKAADAWLMQNWQMIGEGSSVDIRQMFLD